MKQKIEVGQVYLENRSHRYMMLTYDDGNIVQLGDARAQWERIDLYEYFSLYRNADGTLASPEPDAEYEAKPIHNPEKVNATTVVHTEKAESIHNSETCTEKPEKYTGLGAGEGVDLSTGINTEKADTKLSEVDSQDTLDRLDLGWRTANMRCLELSQELEQAYERMEYMKRNTKPARNDMSGAIIASFFDSEGKAIRGGEA